MKGKLTMASGAFLLALGGGLIFVGILGFAGRYDADLDRAGMAQLGVLYWMLGALVAVCGWLLLKRGWHRKS